MAHVRLRARDPEEPGPGRGEAGPGGGFDRRGGCGRIGGLEQEPGFNEAGVDRGAFHVPNPGIGGRCDVLAHRRNPAIANDQGAARQNLAGPGDDSAADQGMNAQRQRPEAGREEFTGRSTANLRPPCQSDHRQEADELTGNFAAHAAVTVCKSGRGHKARPAECRSAPGKPASLMRPPGAGAHGCGN